VTAAKIYALAAYYQGYKGVTAKPTYFSERRGAPVAVHTRISSLPVRTFSNVTHPDIAVVLDENLLQMVNVTADLCEGGLIVVNTAKSYGELGLAGPFDVALSDAFAASKTAGLVVEGNVLISTSILGALAAGSALVGIEPIQKATAHKFRGKALERNLAALELAYRETKMYRRPLVAAAAGT
jgi:2-oxoacid:acceptor oxidoreductase gamma subunit (pyruvate/2-ketoisovalerate family)